MRFGLTEELPQHPKALDMLRFALRKLGPWLIALVITVYMSYALPSSLGKSLAMVLAYALVVGTCFSAICVIAFSCSTARTATAPCTSCGIRPSGRCG
jgi:hypothetical protein